MKKTIYILIPIIFVFTLYYLGPFLFLDGTYESDFNKEYGIKYEIKNDELFIHNETRKKTTKYKFKKLYIQRSILIHDSINGPIHISWSELKENSFKGGLHVYKKTN